MNAPRDDLFRMSPEFELRTDDATGPGNLLVGYPAVFNTPTRIDSWEGKFDEIIAPGAFKRTLEHRGDQVKVLFDHGFDPSIGNKPIASLRSLAEDDHGLRVEAAFIDRPYAHDIREAIRAGAIDGMSFRFSVTDEEWDDTRDVPLRTIRSLKLYEVGPVTFPAYEATTVGVRSLSTFQAWRQTTTNSSQFELAEGTSNDPPPVGSPKRHLTPQHRQRLRRLLARMEELHI